MARWLQFVSLLLGLTFVGVRGMMGADAASGFVPITVENSAEVRLLDTVVTDNRSTRINFSPDGKYLANYSQVWNLATSSEVPLSGANPLAFSPDSSLLVISKTDSTALLNLKTGAILELLAEASYNATFSADGLTITLTSALDSLRRDCNTTAALCTENPVPPSNATLTPNDRIYNWLADHREAALQLDDKYDSFVFSPNGLLIAGYKARENQSVALIDARTAQYSTFETRADRLAFSPNSRLLVTAGSEIQFWLLNGTEATYLASVAGGGDITISPDGSTLANRLRSGIILIYGVPTPERQVESFVISAEIVPSSVNVRAEPSGEAEIVGTAGGNVLAGARNETNDYVYLPDYNGWVRADSTYLQLEAGLTVDILPILETPQAAALLATATPLPPIATVTPTLTPAPTGTPGSFSLPPIGTPIVEPLSPPAGIQPITSSNLADIHLLGVLPVEFDNPWRLKTVYPQNNQFVGTPYDYRSDTTQIQYWDLMSLSAVTTLELQSNRLNMVSSLDGKLLAYSFGYGGEIHIFDVENRIELSILSVSTGREYTLIDHLALSPDKTLLAVSGYSDVPTQIWDLTTNEVRFSIPIQDSPMVFTPDSNLVAVATQRATRFFNTTTGELEYSLTNVSGPIRFSPDGMLMATTSSTSIYTNDYELQIREVETGEIHSSISYKSNLAILAFSPDGQFLATTNNYETLQLWDVETGDPLTAFTAQGGAAFSPDGKLLVTSDPFQIIDLTTGKVHTIEGNYIGQNPIFSSDGASLLLGDETSTTVFGIPDTLRPTWEPITGHIIPSGVNVRSSPEQSADVIGYASGDVRISGRNSGGVYLPESGGWVWSDDNFLDLGEHTLADLPVIAFEK